MGRRAEMDNAVHLALVDVIARNGEYFPDPRIAADLIMVPAYLRVMGEPSLAPGRDVAGEAYRFLHMPSFSPPTCVRIDESGVTARAWLGIPVDGKGKPGFDETRALTSVERQTFQSLLAASGFWEMTPKGGAQGLDGTFWVLEGRRQNAHHVVIRWSPDKYGTEAPFVRLGQFMIALAPELVSPPPTEEEEKLRRRAKENQREERERKRAEAITRSNEIAGRLIRDFEKGLEPMCPHCRRQTNSMRFVDKRPDAESYFVCGLCQRWSTGRELDRGELDP